MNPLLLVIQLTVIIVAGRLAGKLVRRIGQPAVVGEMAAGIMLGPSCLGLLWPAGFEQLFPATSLHALSALSHIGLILFLFVVGLKLDLSEVKRHSGIALFAAGASVAVPLALGMAAAFWMHPRIAPAGVAPLPFALFIGAAFSVTAFPVLARILLEHGLVETPLGSVALSCAAVDDVAAWVLLAVITALVGAKHVAHSPLAAIGMLIAFLAISLFVLRPFLHRSQVWMGSVARSPVAAILLAFACSAVTEYIGVHALFGAFVAGLMAPRRQDIIDKLTESIEPLTTTLLLPIFFALVGLRTSLASIHGRDMWLYGLLLLVVAIGGKWGGAMIAARAGGLSWRDASGLGILMNTRGLVGQVVLNVGLDLGILSPGLFSLLVFMALITTTMTSPLLNLTYPLQQVDGTERRPLETASFL